MPSCPTTPPTALLYQVVRLAKLAFDPRHCNADETSTSSPQLAQLLHLCGRLTAADLGLPTRLLTHPPSCRDPATRRPGCQPPATYIPIVDHPHFTMSVFVLSAGEEMPLHDHPRMCGIVKCLAGRLQLRCWTAVDEAGRPVAPAHMRRPDDPPHSVEVVRVRREPEQLLDARSAAVALTPTLCNYHQMAPLRTGNGVEGEGAAAFLDILAPPYTAEWEPRGCTYYREVVQRAPRPADEQSDTTEAEVETVWMVPVPEPRRYWCNFVPYELPEESTTTTTTTGASAPVAERKWTDRDLTTTGR